MSRFNPLGFHYSTPYMPNIKLLTPPNVSCRMSTVLFLGVELREQLECQAARLTEAVSTSVHQVDSDVFARMFECLPTFLLPA